MSYSGHLLKMKTRYADPIEYTLGLGDDEVFMNDFIGKPVSITFNGQINCIVCGNRTKKAFGQGFCYPCFANAPQAAECIIRPELCRAHLGEGRDVEWERTHHLQTHYVYLAVASGIKVGVTRGDQIPTRWIDQGAWKGIKLAETPNRYLAGRIEVELKQHISDKTNWQKMLKNIQAVDIDPIAERERMKAELPEELQQYCLDDSEVIEINYPVIKFPEKVKSLNLDKTPEVGGTLTGIKGQYLMFDELNVINVRKFSGYFVELSA